MKVSVVIPVFNDSKLLEATLKSVTGQTCKDLEIIVVDDGSKENIMEVTASAKDDRIRFFRIMHVNANVARNKGIIESTGDYIAFLDAGDIWLNNHVESCVEKLQKTGADGLYGSLVTFNPNTGQKNITEARELNYGESMIDYLLSSGSGAQTSTLFMTAESVHDILWDNLLNRHQDYDFVLRYSKKYKLTVKKEATAIHIITGNSKICFLSCQKFIERNLPEISYPVLYRYNEGMLKLAIALKADNSIIEYYKNQLGDEKTINLFILDISTIKKSSGVKRYVENLLDGLNNYPYIKVHRIKFLNSDYTFFKDEGNGNYSVGYTLMTSETITTYKEYCFYQLRHLFAGKENIVLHLNTLNLIDLAIYIKTKIPCKIVSHVHCIPWRGLINSNKTKFNQLHNLWESGLRDKDLFCIDPCEMASYTLSDAVVCVTHNGKDFVEKVSGRKGIDVIYNGLQKTNISERIYKDSTDKLNILFVGSLSDGKGLKYLLKALRKVNESGHSTKLTIAGEGNKSVIKGYEDIVELTGNLPFEQLKTHYQKSDIGVITSLQEQCSYVAIEMAIFGLPIITTEVDGLDEIFTDNLNALKVPVVFSEKNGLEIDTNSLAEKIIFLIENKDLRKDLSANAVNLFNEKFSLKDMSEKTVGIYKRLIE